MLAKKRKIFNPALRILLVTNALIQISGAMLAPIYALFVKDIGGDLLDSSITMGGFALAGGIMTLIAGRFSDRVKESELIIVAGYFIMGLGFLALTQARSIAMLFAIQAVIGMAEALYSPAFDKHYSKHLMRHREGREWGAWESMYYFTTAGGAVIGGFIVVQFSFQTLFAIMGVLSFISSLYIYFLPRKVL